MMKWTEQQTEELRVLWLDHGLSSNMIAEKLGYSRSAIIAKTHRMGWHNHVPATVALPMRARLQNGPPKGAEPPLDLDGVVDIGGEPPPECAVSLQDAESDQCRWPYGDPKGEGFRFCGRKAVAGSSWCKEHYGRAMVAVRR